MVYLGRDTSSGEGVELTNDARRNGLYVIGTTGSGKTTLLKKIVLQDMQAGDGVCVLDPHGDLIDEILSIVPEERANDVILFSPGDRQQLAQPLGLNIFDCDRRDPRQVARVTSTVIDTLKKLFFYSWGPRMEDLLRNSILTLMEKPDTTFLDLWLLLASGTHRQRYIAHVEDAYLQQFWYVQFAAYGEREIVEIVGSSLNKIGRFLADPHIRHIVAQPKSAFSVRQIMDEGKILLCNLSKGDLGEDNSALLGAVIVNLFLIGALTRRDTPPENRRLFHLICDEYQSFATESFPTLQSEARKYAITTTVAHQYRDQLDQLNRGSTLNVANFVVLRTSGIDSVELAMQFDNTPPDAEVEYQPIRFPSQQLDGYYERGTVDIAMPGKQRAYSDVQLERANQIAGLDTLTAFCRILEGKRLVEHMIGIEPVRETPNSARAEEIRAQSLKLGTRKPDIEQFIRERIGTSVTQGGFQLVLEDDEE